jgi:hypothetical protein
MSEIQNATNSIDLAHQFYDDHKEKFEEAATRNDLSDQYFDMLMVEFDRWLVVQGVLEDTAERFDSSSVQRYGVVSHRNQARARINRAARKATDHPAYSISTRSTGNQLRIKLVELYTHDAPADIAGGFRTSTAHYLRQVRRNVKLANTSSAVSDAVRQKVNLCASVMEPLLAAFSWAAMNMQTEIKQQDEGRAMGLPNPNKPRRLK